MKRLPIGIQDYKYMVENDYLYIDKTRYLFELIDGGKVYFMSRPRRFGKSLTISTLYYLFKGEKELFQDTWIYDKIDWEPHPVIKLSMSETENYNEAVLRESLYENLRDIFSYHGLEPDSRLLKIAFKRLIKKLYDQYGKRVVVLIDEYDKPILNHLHEPEKAEKIREILRSFYSTLKDSDPYLEFVMLTGITKFTKTGVFSTLNNLDDISLWDKTASMLGYSEEELDTHFDAFLKTTQKMIGVSRSALFAKIRKYYNGFSFDGKSFVYNPFSILNFFKKNSFQNYWVESGSPSFIVEYAKHHDIRMDQIIGEYIRENILTTYEIEAAPPVSFLIQAGYLTFKGHDEELGYLIDYPNKEVRDSFSELLLVSEFNLKDGVANDIRINVIKALKTRDFEKLYLQMKRTLSNIPYTLFEPKSEYETENDFIARREGFYHSIILTMLWAAGINVRAEELSNLGRSDLILEYEQDTYILELKKQPAQRSIKQIKEKNYAGKYTAPLFYVGVEIDDNKRNLGEYLIEQQENGKGEF